MSEEIEIAKVYRSGRGQAVRLPDNCRFDTTEVYARRVGDSVVLTPVDTERAAQVRAVFDALAASQITLERPQIWSPAEREPLVS